MLKNFIYIIIGLVIAYLIFYRFSNNKEMIVNNIDTIRIEILLYDTIRVVDYDTLYINTITNKFDTIKINDTIIKYLPIHQYHFHKKDIYDLYVSSATNVNLDSINVYNKTIIQTETIINEVKEKERFIDRFNLGIIFGYGYGFNTKQLDKFLGIGVSYELF